MKYKKFKTIEVSSLGMGNMRLPLLPNTNEPIIDRSSAQDIIDVAVAKGINYFDTAYVYQNGDSEKFTGESLQKHPRETYYLATKFHILANPNYKEVFETQLQRLQTDYIDFYLIHALADHTYQSYIDSGCIEYFLEQKKAGRIKYLGFSTHASVETLIKFADYHDWDFTQIQLNYFDWKYGTAKQEYEVLRDRNIPIMVMEPVRGGRLVSLSPTARHILNKVHPEWSTASWAFRWLKRFPEVKVILSGMSTLEQLNENLETFADNLALTDEEDAVLMKACDAFRKEVSVPCTDCRYCCEGCPPQINIPAVIEVYNRFKTDGVWALQKLKAIESEGAPSDCIGCELCSTICPQNIDIPSLMQELEENQPNSI